MQLCQTYNIPKKYFYKHLHFEHFIISKEKQIESEIPLSYLENNILQTLKRRGHIPLFYAALLTYDKESTIDGLDAWRSDIQQETQEADCKTAC